MLYAGLDLSRKRLDVCLLDERGERVAVTPAPPDDDGLRGLAARLAVHGEPVRAAIESMNGARFIHDTLELCGWEVAVADAQRVKGMAPLASKDRPHRRLGAGRAGPARSGAGHLAALPGCARQARAGPLSPPPRPSLHCLEEPHPCHALRLRLSLSRLRPLRRVGAPAARTPRAARALAGDHPGQPAPDRGAPGRDRRLRGRAARPPAPITPTCPC
jgi:hypothetical protein